MTCNPRNVSEIPGSYVACQILIVRECLSVNGQDVIPGPATVRSDGVTLQGDGSVATPLALKAVQHDGSISGAGTLASPLSVIGAGTVHVDGVTLVGDGSVLTPIIVNEVANGQPAGAPPGVLTAALNGPGVLIGDYAYAMAEIDAHGQTPLGPPAFASPNNNTVRNVRPFTRKGMSAGLLYRTKVGDLGTFYLLHNFGGGFEFNQTIFDDNTPDAALGPAAPPNVDTTAVYTMDLSQNVKTLRTHPSVGVVPSDLTLLTGDPATAGVFALDAYQAIVARSARGAAFEAIKTGTDFSPSILALWNGDVADGVAAAKVFQVGGQGGVGITPVQLPDVGGNTSDLSALLVVAQLPAVTTALKHGVHFDIASAGVSAHEQRALTVDFEPGYTGASPVKGIQVNAAPATTGTATAIEGACSGAAGQNIGVSGRCFGGTHNVGVYAGLGGAALTPGNDAALVLDNGATAQDLVRGYNNGTLILQGKADGTLIIASAAYCDGAGISAAYNTNGPSQLNINVGGYLGGGTQPRNTRVFDGQGALVAIFTATTKALDVAGNISGAALITGGPAGSVWTRGAGDPNGALAGAVGDLRSRTDGPDILHCFYVCTTAGNAAGAVWTPK